MYEYQMRGKYYSLRGMVRIWFSDQKKIKTYTYVYNSEGQQDISDTTAKWGAKSLPSLFYKTVGLILH
jgi:hypothetical protein